MADNTINTRTSTAHERKASGMVQSYVSDNLLSSPWPVLRGRRWTSGFAISTAFGVYSKATSSGGK